MVGDENCDERETNDHGDNTGNPVEIQQQLKRRSFGDHYKSILNILIAKEMETPLIKDHLEILKKWQAEDNDENCSSQRPTKNCCDHKARKTCLNFKLYQSLKHQRRSERLNSLKKCYIWTKSENILPFQLTGPPGGATTGTTYQMIMDRIKWIQKALPCPEKGGCPSYVLVQPTYYIDDLSQISGYIYLSIPAKMFLCRLNDSEKKSNPKIFKNQTLKGGAWGNIQVWYPTCPADPLTPLFKRPIEEIKNELINSKELPPAHFARLVHLYKHTDPDLKKLFRLVPLWK